MAPTSVSPRAARRLVEELLDGADASFVEQAVLLTSELVTNAVLHTNDTFTLSALFDPSSGVLRVEVADASPHLPKAAASVPVESIGGRGLRIVADLARRWGIVPTQGGKVVWFELSA